MVLSTFLALPRLRAAGIRRKWLKLRNSVEDGTLLAVRTYEWRGIAMYLTAHAWRRDEIDP